MISICLATRERPEVFKRMCQSALETADQPGGLEFVSYHDSDDKSAYEYLGNHKEIVGERIVLSKMLNECQKAATGDIYMFAADDIIFRSKGWDTKVKDIFESYKDKIVFVFTDDGYHRSRFGVVGFLHKNWIDTVGYLVPPYFPSDYADTWVNDVALMIGRRVYLSVVTEHMHVGFGKADFDITHKDKVARGKIYKDFALYSSKLGERRADANKLQDYIDQHGA